MAIGSLRPRHHAPTVHPYPFHANVFFGFGLFFFYIFWLFFFAALNRNDSDVSREFFQGLGILSNGP